MEPFVPWEEPSSRPAPRAYAKAYPFGHPLLELALDELDEFRENRPYPFDRDLKPEESPTTNPTTGPATGRSSCR